MVICYDNNRKQIQGNCFSACERGRWKDEESGYWKPCCVFWMEKPLHSPEKTSLNLKWSHKKYLALWHFFFESGGWKLLPKKMVMLFQHVLKIIMVPEVTSQYFCPVSLLAHWLSTWPCDLIWPMIHSWPSVTMGFTYLDSTNCELKILFF